MCPLLRHPSMERHHLDHYWPDVWVSVIGLNVVWNSNQLSMTAETEKLKKQTPTKNIHPAAKLWTEIDTDEGWRRNNLYCALCSSGYSA